MLGIALSACTRPLHEYDRDHQTLTGVHEPASFATQKCLYIYNEPGLVKQLGAKCSTRYGLCEDDFIAYVLSKVKDWNVLRIKHVPVYYPYTIKYSVIYLKE